MKTFRLYLQEANKIDSVKKKIKTLGASSFEQPSSKLLVARTSSKRQELLDLIAKEFKTKVKPGGGSSLGHVAIPIDDQEVRIVVKADKPTAGSATDFEDVLVYSIAKNYGLKNVAKEFASKVNPEAVKYGLDIVRTLMQHFGDIKNVIKASGGNIKTDLTPIYKKYGVSSKEPKTDIIVDGKGGEKKVSVKKVGGSQIVSAQAGEASALFAAALEDVKGLSSDPIVALIQQTLRPEAFYKIRDSYKKGSSFEHDLAKALGFRTGTREEIKKFNQNMDSVLGQNKIREAIIKDINEYKPRITDNIVLEYIKNNVGELKNDPNLKEIEHFDKLKTTEQNRIKAYVKKLIGDQQREAQKALMNRGFLKLNEKITSRLSKLDVKEALVKEGMTGRKKFTNKQAVADHLLKWDPKNPSNSSYHKIDDSLIQAYASQIDFSIFDRGQARWGGLGTGGQVSIRVSPSQEKKIASIIKDSFESEIDSLTEEFYKDFCDNILKEGIFDTIKNVASQVKDMILDFVKYLSKLFAKAITYIKKLIDMGWDVFLPSVGIWIDTDQGITLEA